MFNMGVCCKKYAQKDTVTCHLKKESKLPYSEKCEAILLEVAVYCTKKREIVNAHNFFLFRAGGKIQTVFVNRENWTCLLPSDLAAFVWVPSASGWS